MHTKATLTLAKLVTLLAFTGFLSTLALSGSILWDSFGRPWQQAFDNTKELRGTITLKSVRSRAYYSAITLTDENSKEHLLVCRLNSDKSRCNLSDLKSHSLPSEPVVVVVSIAQQGWVKTIKSAKGDVLLNNDISSFSPPAPNKAWGASAICLLFFSATVGGLIKHMKEKKKNAN